MRTSAISSYSRRGVQLPGIVPPRYMITLENHNANGPCGGGKSRFAYSVERRDRGEAWHESTLSNIFRWGAYWISTTETRIIWSRWTSTVLLGSDGVGHEGWVVPSHAAMKQKVFKNFWTGRSRRGWNGGENKDSRKLDHRWLLQGRLLVRNEGAQANLRNWL